MGTIFTKHAYLLPSPSMPSRKDLLSEAETFLKQNWFWLIIILGSWVYAITDFLDLGIRQGWGVFYRDKTEPLVTFIVGIPLVLTLWQAFKANMEVQRQTELQQRPFLRLEWNIYSVGGGSGGGGSSGDFYQIILVNVGSGVAVNVEMTVSLENEVLSSSPFFKTITAMSPSGGVTQVFDARYNKALEELLDPTRNGTSYQVTVIYQNLEKTAYKQVFKTSRTHNDGYEVIEW